MSTIELTQTQQLAATQELTNPVAISSSTFGSFSNAPEIVTGDSSGLQSKSMFERSLPSSSLDQTTLTQSSISGMQIETQMLRDIVLGEETGDTEMLGPYSL